MVVLRLRIAYSTGPKNKTQKVYELIDTVSDCLDNDFTRIKGCKRILWHRLIDEEFRNKDASVDRRRTGWRRCVSGRSWRWPGSGSSTNDRVCAPWRAGWRRGSRTGCTPVDTRTTPTASGSARTRRHAAASRQSPPLSWPEPSTVPRIPSR